ncbi:MAG: gliding motility-associated C-terminal domain-containing protein [Lewinellaceae bacterium]|nr:gliding motility-associated C-terminal domain-containing protein [Lewinellaceae bacterium]
MRTIIFTMLVCLLNAGLTSAQVLQKGQAVFSFNWQNRVAEVIDVRNNSLACTGTNWAAPACSNTAAITQPSNWSLSRMGAIFGIAIDDKGDVFFASSPILGPAIVSDTGIIFRADGANLNTVSDFILNTNTYGPVIKTNTIPNNKNGFGNIAYDRWYQQLFATNLLDGKIYRISGVGSASGTVESVFTPPFNTFNGDINSPVKPGERCWGIGVNLDNDGVVRVYFAREMPYPSLGEVWSVALDGAGEFIASSAILEFQGPNATKITDLAFAPGDRMLIAEREGPHSSEVWQYHGTHLAWAPENQHVTVGSGSGRNCAGGVDYGYRQSPNDIMSLGDCSRLIWASSNAIRLDVLAVYGICAVPSDPYTGTYLQNAIMVDMDGDTINQSKGVMGDVEIFRDDCGRIDICDYLDVSAEKTDDPNAGECCWKFSLTNEYLDDYFTGVQFCGLDGVQLSYSGVIPTWDVVQHVPTSVTVTPHNGNIPIDHFPDLLQLCLSGYSSSPQRVVVKWLGPDPHQSVVCMDTLEFDCGGNANPRCVRAVEDSLVCKNGQYTYTFKIKNNAPFNVQSFVITPLDPNIQVTPGLVNLTPPGIAPNTTSGYFSVTLTGSGLIPGQPFCFYLTAHDQPVLNGNFPHACCTDSVLVDCLPIPKCDPCDGVAISAAPVGSPDPAGGCCRSLSITNNYLPGYFTGVQVNGLGGVQISYVSGWAIQPPVTPSSVTFIPPGGTLGTATYNGFADICLNGFTTPTQQFVVNLLGPNGEVICSDTFLTECPPPPPPTCAVAVKDSLWCEGGQVKYTFSLMNAVANTFDIYSFQLLLSDPAGIQVSQDYFILSTPLPPGLMAGPFTIDLWGSSVQAGNPFCFAIAAHDGIWGGDPDEYPRTCCIDSVNVHCLPIPNCGGQDSCCMPSGIQMPTGLSPNGDNLNDVFVVKGIEKCKEVSLTVYNRWGNVVFHQDQYDNTWGGTNQSGNDLPQGTYYILLTLHDTGSTMAGYVDLRRL